MMIPESNELRFEVTTKCNYNCVICPREELTRDKKTMSFETFKVLLDKVVAEGKAFDTVSFPGMGEPLLDATLDDKVAYAKEKGFRTLMLTNGSLLSAERFRRLEDAGIDSVRVSMYGDTPESYMAVHGIKDAKMFQRVKDNLSEISERKRRAQLLLTYNVVDGRNGASLQAWIDYWMDKADLLEVWRPHNWADAKRYRAVQGQRTKTCGRPWRTPIQIQVDGTVNMCCFDFDGKLLLGDLKTQSLEEIFESSMYMKIKKHHYSGNFEGSGLICENCDQRNADKSDIMVFNSKFDIRERVNKVSTTYSNLL